MTEVTRAPIYNVAGGCPAIPIEDLLRDLILEIKRDEPGCLSILLFGSHARGEAAPCSDIDVRVITRGEPRRRDRVWFVRDARDRWRHVSVGARSFEELCAKAREPEAWSWMAPAYATARVLAGSEAPLLELRAALAGARPDSRAVAGDAQKPLEDLLEATGKMQNAAIANDPAGVLHFARSIAECTWRLLRGLNPVEPFGSARRMLDAIVQLAVAPPRYAEDAQHCLGIVEGARTAADVRRRALRLASGTCALLAAYASALSLPDEVRAYLENGVVEAYLSELIAACPPG